MAVDVDDVESGALGAHGGIAMPAPIGADVGSVHRARLDRIVAGIDWRMLHGNRHFAAIETGVPRTGMGELNSGQGTMEMHAFIHACKHWDVAIVPQPPLDQGRHIAGRMNVGFLGADHGPATFGFHAPHGRHGAGKAHSHPVAMRHLEEPVLGRDRSDSDWLEQNVVTRIPHFPLDDALGVNIALWQDSLACGGEQSGRCKPHELRSWM